MIFNLFYTSSANDLQQHELETLLEKAREKNAVNGITGILLYCDGIFVQLLEGEETKVKETFDRIAKDPRHMDLRNIVSTSSEKRYFPEWKMGYKPMSPEDLALIEKHENLDIKTYFKSSQPYKFIRLLSRSHWQL